MKILLRDTSNYTPLGERSFTGGSTISVSVSVVIGVCPMDPNSTIGAGCALTAGAGIACAAIDGCTKGAVAATDANFVALNAGSDVRARRNHRADDQLLRSPYPARRGVSPMSHVPVNHMVIFILSGQRRRLREVFIHVIESRWCGSTLGAS
ncbi:hypothetical protein B0H17DRAFT_1216783 [Mycena rosella]|uniref:Uncharacterized protein n=1 Tax=Mycena rosella TaxID=1033263 RepID=A0AAD7C665_MYCRO|nr:hypothetical protein B0H17DRAFT_1216783 [Mycena rosella]